MFKCAGFRIANDRLIEHLVAAFDQRGPQGESVIMAYARQLPDKDCPLAERYTRSFNYPEEGCIKTKDDLGRMGIKTFFASNVCCAYDREKFWFQAWFSPSTSSHICRRAPFSWLMPTISSTRPDSLERTFQRPSAAGSSVQSWLSLPI